MTFNRKWYECIEDSKIKNILEKDSPWKKEDSQKRGIIYRVFVPIDKILFKFYYKKKPHKNFNWLPQRMFPILDHILWINKNLIISYPYEIHHEQLKDLILLSEENGFNIEIDGFASKAEYPLRIIIFKKK